MGIVSSNTQEVSSYLQSSLLFKAMSLSSYFGRITSNVISRSVVRISVKSQNFMLNFAMKFNIQSLKMGEGTISISNRRDFNRELARKISNWEVSFDEDYELLKTPLGKTRRGTPEVVRLGKLKLFQSSDKAADIHAVDTVEIYYLATRMLQNLKIGYVRTIKVIQTELFVLPFTLTNTNWTKELSFYKTKVFSTFLSSLRNIKKMLFDECEYLGEPVLLESLEELEIITLYSSFVSVTNLRRLKLVGFELNHEIQHLVSSQNRLLVLELDRISFKSDSDFNALFRNGLTAISLKSTSAVTILQEDELKKRLSEIKSMRFLSFEGNTKGIEKVIINPKMIRVDLNSTCTSLENFRDKTYNFKELRETSENSILTQSLCLFPRLKKLHLTKPVNAILPESLCLLSLSCLPLSSEMFLTNNRNSLKNIKLISLDDLSLDSVKNEISLFKSLEEIRLEDNRSEEFLFENAKTLRKIYWQSMCSIKGSMGELSRINVLRSSLEKKFNC